MKIPSQLPETSCCMEADDCQHQASDQQQGGGSPQGLRLYGGHKSSLADQQLSPGYDIGLIIQQLNSRR